MNYSETYFELDSEEATPCDHCHLICCVYIKGHVEMVDTKDQSNAIVYCVWYLVCQHCRYKDQSMQCIECYVCRDCRYTGVCGSYTTPYTEHYEVWKLYSTLYKVASCLNIQPIFNLQKVLESWDWGLFNHTINTIYVDTVDTGQGSVMHSMLSMSTLSIQKTSTCFCP